MKATIAAMEMETNATDTTAEAEVESKEATVEMKAKAMETAAEGQQHAILVDDNNFRHVDSASTTVPTIYS